MAAISTGLALLLSSLIPVATTIGGAAVDLRRKDRNSLSRDEAQEVLDYMSTYDPVKAEAELADYKEKSLKGLVQRSTLPGHVQTLENLVASDIPGINNNPYWNSLSDSEKISLLQNYVLGDTGNGLGNVDLAQLSADLAEYDNIAVAPSFSDYVNVDDALTDAQAAIDAENEELLASLNEDLHNTGEAYTQARDAMLTQQHQRNAQTMDTMASEMSRARRNAIESGASAGVRIAGNVNALLSAQNKMSQESLNTSNQLAQMLVNQRNAEAGLRNQWRDAQMSTYDRVQNRAQNEMSIGRQRYDAAQADWQSNYESAVSPTNPLGDAMLNYKTKQKSAYGNTNSGGAY